jgi:Abnormal spindle-like microcephaly-assoc'd, ASPM-SPD-2-Hydin/Immunoglobulin domain/Immunoglobulin I-set domain
MLLCPLVAALTQLGCTQFAGANSSASSSDSSQAPSISFQPASQTVAAGQSATFSVTASGSPPLTYQWQRNGTSISDATSASYTTPATTTSDNDAQFTVTVTGTVGNVTSNPATLTVTAVAVAPSITTQPANQTANAGQTATFSVTATGTATLTYQWKKNGTAINGAISASYTTPATTASDNGATFTVTVTNATGNVTSSATTLTVNLPPTISAQPANMTVIVGQTATFSVTATGTGTLTYQWNKNGTAISGATSASYTTPATAATDNGALFSVTVTGVAGNVSSNGATLTVDVPPTITAQPGNQTVTAGQTATFSVTATGTGTLTYQWKKNGTAIGGATSAAFTTPATVVSESGSQYTVVVSNLAGNLSSNAAILTVSPAGQLSASTTQLSYGNVAVGSSSSQSLTLTNTGSGSISITNVSLTGAGLSSAGVSSGLILTAGNSAVLSVTFAPSASGTLSGDVTVTSDAGGTTLTIALSGAAIEPVSHAVTLSLTPNSSNVTGYNIYRSSASSGPYSKLNSVLVTSPNYIDSTVVAAHTYYYVATAVDSSGIESAYSNQVSGIVPTP